jgi:hypothetical protein
MKNKYCPVLYLQKEQMQDNWKIRGRPQITPATKQETEFHMLIIGKNQEFKVRTFSINVLHVELQKRSQ